MVLTGIIASVVTFAIGGSVALAHHSELEASVNCGRVVSWTATAWSDSDPDHRTNHDVRVGYIENGVGCWSATDRSVRRTASRSVARSQYPTSNPPSFTLYAQETVGWGPNEDLWVRMDLPRSRLCVRVECPSTPSTSIDVKCVDGNGAVTVTLTNSGGSTPITFTVTPPGGTPADHVVQPNSSLPVSFTGVADTPAYTVTITANGVDYSKTIAVNCDRPGTPKTSIGVGSTDGNGTVTVTLENTSGDLPVAFTVSAPNLPAADHTLALTRRRR